MNMGNRYSIPTALSEKSGHSLIEDIDFVMLPAPSAAHELSIGLLLWPDFPLLSLAGLVDALRHAADVGDNSKKLRCSWNIMNADGHSPIIASSGVAVRPDSPYCPPRQFDYIAVIGGLLRSLVSGPPEGRAYLREAQRAGVPLIGVCTGSFVLAEEGMLDGRRACLHPYHLAEFTARFPLVRAQTGLDFIDDRGVLSCAGGISVISLVTELVRRHCGPDRATKAIYQMSVTNKVDTASVSVSQALGYTKVADPRLRHAIFLVEQSLVRPISTEWLASEAHLSRRQLTRLFNAELGQPPGEFIRLTRLRYGKWLLHNSRESITEIALRIGFSDCAHFIRQFQREFGCTPGAFRTK
ncbi:helix-turn-helix domain-containing protein [Raoultella sp. WB_B2P2-3]|uniref:Helix-turn-helix domain-containing protein n=1 Tax=Raoultella scottii TaxID=3040937 RepID=A0ABU8YZG3_9ENTR